MKLVKSKKEVSKVPSNKPDTSEIDKKIKEAEKDFKDAKNLLISLRHEKLAIEIAPFQEYEIVNALVSVGKAKQKRTCILEISADEFSATLYARPYKKDGHLSERRFGIYPISGNCTYQDLIDRIKGEKIGFVESSGE